VSVALSSVDTNKWRPLLARDWAPVSLDQPSPDVEERRPLRQRQKRLTEVEVARLAKRYAEGATVYELADEFEIERRTVAVRLKGAGVVLRRQPASADQVTEMVRLYESGLSLTKVADRTGFSTKTVLNCLRTEGVKTRDSHGRERG
jgi:DNA-directed RNA polymerase specialized sigma24 family protein